MTVACQTVSRTGVQVEVQLVKGVAGCTSQEVVDGVACATQQVNLQCGEHLPELLLVETQTVCLGVYLLQESLCVDVE